MKKLFHAVKEFNVDLIPIHAVVDGDNGYPVKEEPANQRSKQQVFRQSNAVHPNPSGYGQMGDCVFCYLKYALNQR